MVGSRWLWQSCAVMFLAVGAGACGAGSDPEPLEAERPAAPEPADSPADSKEAPPAEVRPAEVAPLCLGEHIVAPAPPVPPPLPCTQLWFGADGTEQSRTLRHYDAAGRLLATEHDGFVAERYSYDAAGRLTSLYEMDRSERFTHDACGRLLTRERRGRNTSSQSTYGYDAEGRLVSEKEFTRYTGGFPELMEWVESTFTYDARGQLLEYASISRRNDEEPPSTYLTHHTYDENGRRVRTEVRISGFAYFVTVTEFDYDDAGRLLREQSTETTSGRGQAKVYTYDAEGRPRTLLIVPYEQGTPMPLESSTSWTYPAEGGVVETTEHRSGARRSSITDAEGRQVAWSSSEGGSGLYTRHGSRTYGSRGELLRHEEQQTTPNTFTGQLEEYTYDGAGRLLRVEQRRELSGIASREPLHTETRHFYDADGQPTGSDSWNLDVTPAVLLSSVRFEAACRPPGS